MTILKDLVKERSAGLTVYSPDAARSGLWGNLDEAIMLRTGFQIVRRQVIKHDINSVMRFYREPGAPVPATQDVDAAFRRYQTMPASEIQYGHLVVALLLSGPSLLTIWRGENANAELLTLKGKTQPADSPPSSIRGGFGCDNGVCNLIHSSDDNLGLERELQALNVEGWLEEEVNDVPAMRPRAFSFEALAHSGIFTLYRGLCRLMKIEPKLDLPAWGAAVSTRSLIAGALLGAKFVTHSSLLNAFFAGDLVTVTQIVERMDFKAWERFVIQCATVSQDAWR